MIKKSGNHLLLGLALSAAALLACSTSQETTGHSDVYVETASAYGEGVSDGGSRGTDPNGVSAGLDENGVSAGLDENGLPLNRKFIRDAHLRLDLPDQAAIDATFPRGRTLAGTYGGYIQAETARGMTIKVPNERFEAALNDIEGWGEIGDRNIRVNDVTGEHMDLSLRIENARRMQTRLKSMLESARNIEETLQLEQEIQRVTLSLEKMEAQRAVLDRDIAYSTIHLSLAMKATETRSGPVLLILEYTYKAVRWFFVWDE